MRVSLWARLFLAASSTVRRRGKLPFSLGTPKSLPLEAQPLGELPVQGEAVGPHPLRRRGLRYRARRGRRGEARGGEAQGVQARSHVLGAAGGEEEGQRPELPHRASLAGIVEGMVKPDWWIREMARKGMIEPFEERLVREGVISYGLSSFGYDLRAAPEWKIFTNVFSSLVDPKNFDPKSFVEYEGRRW